MFVCVIAHYQNGMVQMSGGAGGLVVDTSVIELNMVRGEGGGQERCVFVNHRILRNFVALPPTLLAVILCICTLCEHMY